MVWGNPPSRMIYFIKIARRSGALISVLNNTVVDDKRSAGRRKRTDDLRTLICHSELDSESQSKGYVETCQVRNLFIISRILFIKSFISFEKKKF